MADCLHDILEILAKKPEPIAGLHGYLKQVSRKEEQEFCHVPAKALGSAIAHFLDDIGGTLKKKPWSEQKTAGKLALALSKRAGEVKTIATPPGDRLSAISLSHEAHKGDAGIHSVASAELLAELADAPSAEALVIARRTTISDLKEAGYVSVNPQVAGWRAFLADVRMRLDDPKYRTFSDKPREDKEAALLILEKAKEEFEEAEELDTQFIR